MANPIVTFTMENGDGGEDTLANAPERRDRAFVVPKTVE